MRIDPATNEVTASVEVGDLPAGVALGAGALWVVDQVSRSLVRVDPATATVTSSIDLPVAAVGRRGHHRDVWITDRPGQTVVQVDIAENEVVATRLVPGGHPTNAWSYGDGVTVLGDRVLIASGQQIATFDPGGRNVLGRDRPGVLARRGGIGRRLARQQRHEGAPAARPGESRNGGVTGGPGVISAERRRLGDTSIAFDGGSLWIRSYPEDLLIRVFVETP